jgi:thioredoxin-related protein
VWPCKLLERNVFPQKEVGEFYNKNFINSRFDMEKGEGRDIARKYGINSYPSLLFINGNGEVVFKGMGYMDVSDFLGMGKDVLNPDNKIEKRIEKFHAGEKDLEFLLKLMKDVAKNDFAFGQKVSERYFQVKENSEFTKDDAGILLYFTKSSDDENFKTFVKRKADLLKFIPENTLNDFEKQLRLTTIIQNL